MSIKLIEYDTHRDGGTVYLTFSFGNDVKQRVYIDYRIHTTSRGKWFTAYPSNKEAEDVDIVNINFFCNAIKEYIRVLSDVTAMKYFEKSEGVDRLLHILKKVIDDKERLYV